MFFLFYNDFEGWGQETGVETEESFQGLPRFSANDTSIVSLLGLEGTERQGYGHQWQAGTLLVGFKEFLEKKAWRLWC